MTDIRYDLRDYRDLFAKLKREAARFAVEPTADNLFNTMVTAWSLGDWVLADVPVTAAMEDDLRALTGKTAASKQKRDESKMAPEMRICQDVADASKHGPLHRSPLLVTGVTPTESTYGAAIYGFSRYGDPESRYAIEAGGVLHDAQAVVAAVVARYEAFFAAHGL